MTGCKRIHIRYHIPPVHEKLAKVTIRIFHMARKTKTCTPNNLCVQFVVSVSKSEKMYYMQDPYNTTKY